MSSSSSFLSSVFGSSRSSSTLSCNSCASNSASCSFRSGTATSMSASSIFLVSGSFYSSPLAEVICLRASSRFTLDDAFEKILGLLEPACDLWYPLFWENTDLGKLFMLPACDGYLLLVSSCSLNLATLVLLSWDLTSSLST